MSGSSNILFPRCFSLALSDRGDIVAAPCHRIIVANVHTGKRLISFRALRNSSSICFSPDGSELAIKNTFGQIAVADPYTGRILRDFGTIEIGSSSNIKYSPCGSFLVTATHHDGIQILNSRTGVEEWVWKFPGEYVNNISHTSDRKTWCFLHHIIARAPDRPPDIPYLSILDWTYKSYAVTPLSFGPVSEAILSPSGRHVALSGYVHDPFSYVYQIIELSGEVVTSGRGEGTFHLRWSQNGDLLSIADGRGLKILTFPEFKTVAEFKSSENYDIVFAPDNSIRRKNRE